ncbi:hypothetical protein PoB_003865100 [Plakobranchus ocellatus]|uniref:Uncharacterized protein n=1 Tax=Plakobranchus ocellatus TaxID=259542 RepID=A0AAV4ALW0_9GAST|nr:hypothetical protein PoB_003865100 [Plakobranchus ocellatus]
MVLRCEFLCRRTEWRTFAAVEVPFLGQDVLLTPPEAKRLVSGCELQDRDWGALESSEYVAAQCSVRNLIRSKPPRDFQTGFANSNGINHSERLGCGA